MPKEIYWKMFYHGTNKATASKIIKEGFKRGSYFSTHLEDAIKFGKADETVGVFVFQVSIKLPYDHTYWEYVTTNKIPARQIVKLREFYAKPLMFENKKLGDRIFKFNLKKALGDRYRSHMAKCGATKRYHGDSTSNK